MTFKNKLSTFRQRITNAKKVFKGEKSIDKIYSSKKKFIDMESAQYVNSLIAEGGWIVFQKLQWKNLTNYLAGN